MSPWWHTSGFLGSVILLVVQYNPDYPNSSVNVVKKVIFGNTVSWYLNQSNKCSLHEKVSSLTYMIITVYVIVFYYVPIQNDLIIEIQCTYLYSKSSLIVYQWAMGSKVTIREPGQLEKWTVREDLLYIHMTKYRL